MRKANVTLTYRQCMDSSTQKGFNIDSMVIENKLSFSLSLSLSVSLFTAPIDDNRFRKCPIAQSI